MKEVVTYSRLCPTCGTEKFYKTEERLKVALKNGRSCKSCTTKEVYVKNPTKNKGKNNPMFKKGCVEVWRETLTPEEFETRLSSWKLTQTIRNTGSGNPMYGKPPPVNAGRGISGTWKGRHFRSLLELQFLEWHVQTHGVLPESAERKEFSVRLQNGKMYFPDFVTTDGKIVEIKPKKLLALNAEKFDAARKRFGDRFIVMTNLDFHPGIETRLNTFEDLHLNRRKTHSKGFKKILETINRS